MTARNDLRSLIEEARELATAALSGGQYPSLRLELIGEMQDKFAQALSLLPEWQEFDQEKVALKEALESMVWQFGYHAPRKIHTGGLSALELAFNALKWDDPRVIEDSDGVLCDVESCFEWVSGSGGAWRETGYWCCCAKHNESARINNPQPQMKKRAIKREESRDKVTGILPPYVKP